LKLSCIIIIILFIYFIYLFFFLVDPAPRTPTPRFRNNLVSGQCIEFDTMPSQKHPPAVKCFSKEENTIIKSEVSNLLKKPVIVETAHEPGEFISPIFVRPKKDGSDRMILNLKSLNKHVKYNHFKVDTLHCTGFTCL